MQSTCSLTKSVLILTALLGFNGCSGSASTGPTGAAASAEDEAEHAHEDEHGHAVSGPHGGEIIELGEEEYHAELTHDEAAHKVGVYLLDSAVKGAVPIDAASVTINCVANGQPKQFVLPAVPQSGESAGSASYFEAVSEELCEGLDAPNATARLNVTIGGKPYVGLIESHGHDDAEGHGHSHAGDDALVWRETIDEQGYQIAVGHHGQTLRAGRDVEPAVQITRTGQPIADAQVFNALLAADGRTVLADEVATVYEPTTSEEPAHYAQGALKIPADMPQVVIRYRIVLPAGGGERTIDVPVAVE